MTNRKKPPNFDKDAPLGFTSKGTVRKHWHMNGSKTNKGRGFDNRPENCGRKKKIYTILKEKGYSKDDITTAFGELAFYNEIELQAAKDNKKFPIITRIVANQFLLALKDGSWGKIHEIMEHTIGKPLISIQSNQDLEITFED